jgi:hypothetical protein
MALPFVVYRLDLRDSVQALQSDRDRILPDQC